MDRLSPEEIVVMFLSFGILLGAARLMGEVAKRFNQPAVLGEILAGILLGPTVLGAIFPEANAFIFPQEGHNAIALNSLTTFAVVLFLLVAGIEVDLSMLFKLRRSAALIGISGLSLPFSIGFGLGHVLPGFFGMEAGANVHVFSLFLGVALAISALPVIAKTLMDLNLYRSDLGMLVIAVAIFYDIIGWIIFAVILSLINPDGSHGNNIAFTIILTLAFVAFLLTAGRWAINRSLLWLQAHTSWPGGVMGFALTLGLLGAAFTEWIGIHAIFGAFIVGVALGDSPHLKEHTRVTIDQFISFIFAPLFFASIGLRVNFIAHFDPLLVLVVLLIACIGQTVGSGMGARWAGFPQRQSWAIGFALNARGAMEIVLALLALQYGVIGERLFVALVVMALVTSVIAGPTMQRLLREKKGKRFIQFITSRTFVPALQAADRGEAIAELSSAVAKAYNLDEAVITDAVITRESIMSTGIGNNLAVPHARLANIAQPIVAVGLHQTGFDFDSPDGLQAKVVVLLLTPEKEDGSQVELLGDIARTFSEPESIKKALACHTMTEFLAFINTSTSHQRQPHRRNVM